ncbi:hypothetical protein [Synechococcus sp. HK01-R]|uniref:hypothetical protein n=1 Tax=Synechococcus sp. HK01-R TaxID=2751171 RepID=UPI0016295599|nr:hypothetical protein [Synechococcus sp. HK01-R]QNG26096.1 hypothetical protein H0O21_07190 [Synechococcus sp. HK01-R]
MTASSFCLTSAIATATEKSPLEAVAEYPELGAAAPRLFELVNAMAVLDRLQAQVRDQEALVDQLSDQLKQEVEQ